MKAHKLMNSEYIVPALFLLLAYIAWQFSGLTGSFVGNQVLLFAGLVYYLLHTRLGQEIKAVGLDSGRSALVGINVDTVRIKVMVISTVLAALGQLIYLQNIGMFDVYTAHMNTGIISCAALQAGGASIKSAKIRHAVIGVFLFHTLFIVSPQAGQNLFNNAALGEYFRSFIAYGTIAFALIINIRNENQNGY